MEQVIQGWTGETAYELSSRVGVGYELWRDSDDSLYAIPLSLHVTKGEMEFVGYSEDYCDSAPPSECGGAGGTGMIRFTIERIIATPAERWVCAGDVEMFCSRYDRLPLIAQGALSARWVGHWQLPAPRRSTLHWGIERIVSLRTPSQ